jgi:hypothetical protein
MHGGMHRAIELKIHGGKMGTDGSSGDIPKESIAFTCQFPSGAVDSKPLVHLPPGHPDEYVLEAIVLCAIPTEDRRTLDRKQSIYVTLTRTIKCDVNAETKCPPHLLAGTERYPPVELCPAARPIEQRNLSACLFVNLPTDLKRASGDFFSRSDQPLNHSIGLDLITNWISFHVLVGFEHFYIYSSMFDQRTTPEWQKKMIELEVTLRQHMQQFSPSLVTFIDWKVPLKNKSSVKSVWGPAFRWANMVQIPVFNDALWRFREHTRWLAIFDLDEYMTPNVLHGHNNVIDALVPYEDGYNFYAAKQVYWSKLNISSFFADRGHVVMEHELHRRQDDAENWQHGMKSIMATTNIISAGIHSPALPYSYGLKDVAPSANMSIELNHFKWSGAVGSKHSSWDHFEETTYLRDCYAHCVRALAKRFARASKEDFECVVKSYQDGCRPAL